MNENTRRTLNPEELDQVTGGTLRTVNTGISNLNAALRTNATKSSRQIASIPNGVQVDTVSDELVWDPDSQRHFVQVTYDGKTGWIASSILGMRR